MTATIPPLDDPRHEAFAQALARGLSLRAASNEAKFFGSLTRIRERSERPAIAARAEALRLDARWGGQPELEIVYAKLIALADRATKDEKPSAAAFAAAKSLLAEAARLKRSVAPTARGVAPTASEISYAPPELTKAEWLAAFAPNP